ncbi:hypothetical protein ACFVZD_41250 [Streptomyces sp. NPDC058287]
MDRDEEQLLRRRIYGADHDHPGPLPNRGYAESVAPAPAVMVRSTTT